MLRRQLLPWQSTATARARLSRCPLRGAVAAKTSRFGGGRLDGVYSTTTYNGTSLGYSRCIHVSRVLQASKDEEQGNESPSLAEENVERKRKPQKLSEGQRKLQRMNEHLIFSDSPGRNKSGINKNEEGARASLESIASKLASKKSTDGLPGWSVLEKTGNRDEDGMEKMAEDAFGYEVLTPRDIEEGGHDMQFAVSSNSRGVRLRRTLSTKASRETKEERNARFARAARQARADQAGTTRTWEIYIDPDTGVRFLKRHPIEEGAAQEVPRDDINLRENYSISGTTGSSKTPREGRKRFAIKDRSNADGTALKIRKVVLSPEETHHSLPPRVKAEGAESEEHEAPAKEIDGRQYGSPITTILLPPSTQVTASNKKAIRAALESHIHPLHPSIYQGREKKSIIILFTSGFASQLKGEVPRVRFRELPDGTRKLQKRQPRDYPGFDWPRFILSRLFPADVVREITESSRPTLRVIMAVVDKLPGSANTETSSNEDGGESAEGSEGIAYLLASNTHISHYDYPKGSSSSSSNPSQETERTFTLRLESETLYGEPNDQGVQHSFQPYVATQIPLANTVFQTEGRFTSLLAYWAPVPLNSIAFEKDETDAGLPVGYRHNLADVTVVVRVASQIGKGGGRGKKKNKGRGDLEMELSTPLVPLTQPRVVRAAMGNIIRQLSAVPDRTDSTTEKAEKERMQTEMEPMRASAELEDAVNSLVADQKLPPGPVAVWALIVPKHLQEQTENKSLLFPEADISSLDLQGDPHNLQPADLTALLKQGARLHRVVSGGGGWGKKAGLLSIAPAVDFESASASGSTSGASSSESNGMIEDEDGALLPPWMQPEAKSTDTSATSAGGGSGSPVQEGDTIQFLLSVPEIAKPPTPTPGSTTSEAFTVQVGTIPSSVDAMPIPSSSSSEGSEEVFDKDRLAEQIKILPNYLGVLSEKGVALERVSAEQQRSGSMLDVPYSWVKMSSVRKTRTNKRNKGSQAVDTDADVASSQPGKSAAKRIMNADAVSKIRKVEIGRSTPDADAEGKMAGDALSKIRRVKIRDAMSDADAGTAAGDNENAASENTNSFTMRKMSGYYNSAIPPRQVIEVSGAESRPSVDEQLIASYNPLSDPVETAVLSERPVEVPSEQGNEQRWAVEGEGGAEGPGFTVRGSLVPRRGFFDPSSHAARRERRKSLRQMAKESKRLLAARQGEGPRITKFKTYDVPLGTAWFAGPGHERTQKYIQNLEDLLQREQKPQQKQRLFRALQAVLMGRKGPKATQLEDVTTSSALLNEVMEMAQLNMEERRSLLERASKQDQVEQQIQREVSKETSELVENEEGFANLSETQKDFIKQLATMTSDEIEQEKKYLDTALHDAKVARRKASKAIEDGQMPEQLSEDKTTDSTVSVSARNLKDLDFKTLSAQFLELQDELMASAKNRTDRDILSAHNLRDFWQPRGYPTELVKMLHEYYQLSPALPNNAIDLFGKPYEGLSKLPFGELRAAAKRLPKHKEMEFWRKWKLMRRMGDAIESQSNSEFREMLRQDALLEQAGKQGKDLDATSLAVDGDAAEQAVEEPIDLKQFNVELRDKLFFVLGRSIRLTFAKKHEYWHRHGLSAQIRNLLSERQNMATVLKAAMQWIARLNYRAGDAVGATVLDTIAWHGRFQTNVKGGMLRFQDQKFHVTYRSGDTQSLISEAQGVKLMHHPDARSPLLSDDREGWRTMSEKWPWEFLYRYFSAKDLSNLSEARTEENDYLIAMRKKTFAKQLAPIFDKFDAAIMAHGDREGLVEVDIGAEIREHFPELLRTEGDLRADLGIPASPVKLRYESSRVPILRVPSERSEPEKIGSEKREKPLFKSIRFALNTKKDDGDAFQSQWQTSPNSFAYELMEKKLRARVHQKIKERMGQNDKAATAGKAKREKDEDEAMDYDQIERAIERKLDRMGIKQPSVKRLDMQLMQREAQPWEDEGADEAQQVVWDTGVAPEAVSEHSPKTIRSWKTPSSDRQTDLDSFVSDEVDEQFDEWSDEDGEVIWTMNGPEAEQLDKNWMEASRETMWAASQNEGNQQMQQAIREQRRLARESRGSSSSDDLDGIWEGMLPDLRIKKVKAEAKPKTLSKQREEKEKLRESILKLLGRM